MLGLNYLDIYVHPHVWYNFLTLLVLNKQSINQSINQSFINSSTPPHLPLSMCLLCKIYSLVFSKACIMHWCEF